MNEGLYFFAGSIVTLAVVGFATWLREPTEAERRRQQARAKRPKDPTGHVIQELSRATTSHLQQPVTTRVEPRMRVSPPLPPKAVKNSGIGNPAYRKGKR